MKKKVDGYSLELYDKNDKRVEWRVLRYEVKIFKNKITYNVVTDWDSQWLGRSGEYFTLYEGQPYIESDGDGIEFHELKHENIYLSMVTYHILDGKARIQLTFVK